MMHAVVMQITKGGKAYVLCDDGCFAKVKDYGWAVGQQIVLAKTKDEAKAKTETMVTAGADEQSEAKVEKNIEAGTKTTAQLEAQRKTGSADKADAKILAFNKQSRVSPKGLAHIHHSLRHYDRIRRFGAAAAACAALFFVGFLTFTPTAYASLDVNPSITYSINRFGLVVSSEAVNEEANEVVAALDKQGTILQPVDDVIAATLHELQEEGYLYETDTLVVLSITSSTSEHSEELANKIASSIESAYDDLTVITLSTDEAQRQEALDLGTTAGKLVLAREAAKVSTDSETSDEKEWLQKSIDEIVACLHDNDATPSRGEASPNKAQDSSDTADNECVQQDARDMTTMPTVDNDQIATPDTSQDLGMTSLEPNTTNTDTDSYQESDQSQDLSQSQQENTLSDSGIDISPMHDSDMPLDLGANPDATDTNTTADGSSSMSLETGSSQDAREDDSVADIYKEGLPPSQ